MKTVDDFSIGQEVLYVPRHAGNDTGHPDCEHGRVSGINDVYVFVKFDPAATYGQACDPRDLQ
jgi:hypothetical protein